MKYFFTFLLLFILGISFFYSTHSEIMDESAILAAPSKIHILGTDELGRDILARLIDGAKVSLSCALLATLIAGMIGSFVGVIAGYFGGKVDQLLMRLIDVGLSVPDLLLYILLGAYVGRNFSGMVFSLAILGWLDVARLMRDQTRHAQSQPFIEGARALGVSPLRLIIKHLFPQAIPILQTVLLMKIPAMILAESSLSFIGLGLTPPQASWGTMASEGYVALQFYPRLILLPSAAIFLSVLTLNLLAKKMPKC